MTPSFGRLSVACLSVLVLTPVGASAGVVGALIATYFLHQGDLFVGQGPIDFTVMFSSTIARQVLIYAARAFGAFLLPMVALRALWFRPRWPFVVAIGMLLVGWDLCYLSAAVSAMPTLPLYEQARLREWSTSNILAGITSTLGAGLVALLLSRRGQNRLV